MPKQILVVDDEPLIGRLIKMGLEVNDFTVKTSTSGFEAMEILKEWIPDLAILDVMMPGMNGFELCEAIKKMPQTRQVKVMFLTALGQSLQVQQGMSLGAVDYIFKPYDPLELLGKVRKHLQDAR